jgi:Methyltransferase domain
MRGLTFAGRALSFRGRMKPEIIAAILPSRHLEPLRYGLGAWTEHIYFAYDLVAQIRPRLLVELGADRGESYFAFCQSAQENKTSTRCFAIDHWRGDAHAGSYDDTTFADVDSHNRAHYAAFSTLLRSSFDAALDHFASESIDLLHIDGHHTEAAARQDVESWLPKLRPGGILLMHDVTMRGRDFGVWKIWAELAAHGRSWTFDEPPGLGMWEKPPSSPGPPFLETLFAEPNESQAVLTDYYRERSDELQKEMAQQWRDGTIRSAPMASETVIQIFWTNDGNYSEENSTGARIGHEGWKEVTIAPPSDGPINGLRIDFVSALTIIEIATITVELKSGALLFRATTAAEFEAIRLLGDCARVASESLTIKVTGIDPQLYLPPFPAPGVVGPLLVRMRLRVNPTRA